MGDGKPTSLITSYHYLRYILLGIFLYISGRFIDLCSSECPFDTSHTAAVKILLVFLYAVIGGTLLAADIRNYVLYKLLLHKYYEVAEPERPRLKSNLHILTSLLKRRGIYDKMKGSTLQSIEALDKELREHPGRRSCKLIYKKLLYNWMIFWAVQPGPVSLCILSLYVSCIVVLAFCGLFLWRWSLSMAVVQCGVVAGLTSV